jgi:hypothetical protein
VLPYSFLETAEEAAEAPYAARGAELEDTLTAVRASLVRGATVVLTGDFNEPSHRGLDHARGRRGAGAAGRALSLDPRSGGGWPR